MLTKRMDGVVEAFSDAVADPASRIPVRSACTLALVTLLVACGGGSSPTESQPTGPAADFALSASPSLVSAFTGTATAPVTVSVTGFNGFAGSVSVSVTGLPAGATCSPACPFTVAANSSASVSFVVPGNTAAGSFSVVLSGSSGPLARKATVTVTVTPNLLGSVDVPMSSATVSSQLFVFGWAFEQLGSVSRIDVLVDGAVTGQALYGFIARPGVQQVYPNAPLNSGFSYKLDTRQLPNGVHTIRARVTDVAGNAAFIQWPQPNITVMVDNPPPVPTGPVANISLTAPKTSLLVGDIVQATATATDSAGNPVVPQYSWASSNGAVARVTADFGPS